MKKLSFLSMTLLCSITTSMFGMLTVVKRTSQIRTVRPQTIQHDGRKQFSSSPRTASKKEHFDSFKHLPEDSLIKKECYLCGFGNWLYSNAKQKACTYIRDTLGKYNEPDPEESLLETFFGLLVGPNGRDLMNDLNRQSNVSEMKKNVFVVLGEKHTKEEMIQEHNKLSETAKAIRTDRNKRYQEARIVKNGQKAAQKQDPY